MMSKVFAIVSLVTSLAIGSPVRRVDAAESKSIRWLIAGKAAAALASSPDASRLLDGASPYVIGRKDVPEGWNAVHVRSFKSIGDIQKTLTGDKLPADVKGILYDYEKWRFTPEEEQQNPARAVKQAAELVHGHGLLFIATPAVDLVPVLAPDSDMKRQDATYLRLGLAADAACYADVVDIQAQRFQNDTLRYEQFVKAAAAQARAANPRVVLLAGISTQPGGRDTSAEDMLRAIQATRHVVDGYWLNIPEPSEFSPNVREFRPDLAIEVVKRIAGR